MRKMPLLARPVNEREAALRPQVNIQQNGVRQGLRRDGHETVFQALREDCFMTFAFEPILEEFAILGIVIHHKNPVLHSCSFCCGSDVNGEWRAHTGTPLHSYYRPN